MQRPMQGRVDSSAPKGFSSKSSWDPSSRCFMDFYTFGCSRQAIISVSVWWSLLPPKKPPSDLFGRHGVEKLKHEAGLRRRQRHRIEVTLLSIQVV